MWDEEYEGEDDGYDGYDEMQKLLTGSSPAASSTSRPPFETQEQLLPTPVVRRPVNDLAGASMAAGSDTPEATREPPESYDISDEEEEDGEEELEHESAEPIAAEQPKGMVNNMLLKAKPKTLARPPAQAAQKARPQASHPWKHQEASQQGREAMKPLKGAPPQGVAKEVAAVACKSQGMTSVASNRNKAATSKKRKGHEVIPDPPSFRNPKQAACARTAKAAKTSHPEVEKTHFQRSGTHATRPWANSQQARHQRQGVQVAHQEASQAKKGKNGTRHDWGPESKHAGSEQLLDCFGRAWNMNKVVVNFLNIGHYYGSKVMKLEQQMFQWEGVRRCVRYLKTEMNLQVTGVIPENYRGMDNGRKQLPLPADIKNMCETVEETPRFGDQRNHRSADDEMTIKCAYRRACRFLDNDNYKEWVVQLQDAKARTWLQKHKDMAHMRFYFDIGTGTFDILGGNYPTTSLAQNDVVDKHDLCNMGRG
ncbi:CARNS1 [Symbiodinium microadriaticum]|nr:CARNS1 [Symbiodinium microadriaticum]CAE7815769.1 CARNS1 [Symbiodinium sp. KB8]